MDDPSTCGKGLAEHSALPAKLAELIGALAENLEHHQRALDLSDANARAEYEAYVKLAAEHREISARLRAVAEHMAGYRDLPMGKHDDAAFADPRIFEAFATFVKREEELLALLRSALERDRQMLGAFAGEGAGGA